MYWNQVCEQSKKNAQGWIVTLDVLKYDVDTYENLVLTVE